MEPQTKAAEEAFWGEIPDSDREEIATQIAEQILTRPYGQLDVGYLVPLAYAFTEAQERIKELEDEMSTLQRYGPADED